MRFALGALIAIWATVGAAQDIPEFPDGEHAGAHMAGLYDPSCCSNRDCIPVSGNQSPIWRPGPNGGEYVLPDTGEVLRADSWRVKPSRNSQNHVCRNTSTQRLLCIYVAPSGG